MTKLTIATEPPVAGTASEELEVDVTRILHLTDLHCGRGFQEHLWAHLLGISSQLKPHLVLVTGDLVNNPYWWTLKKARGLLEAIQVASSEGDKRPKIFVIPGNHDTRLTGLIPIAYIAPAIVVVCGLISTIGYFHYAPRAWLWAVPLAATLLFARYLCLRRFEHFFSEFAPKLPTVLKDHHLVLYPFDSATSSTSGAGGDIPLNQFVSARGPVEGLEIAPYRIALVHHHSVPIPYDNKSEALMVLKNAGAFLSEIASCGVRLVLSGHKHHQHVSRVTINAETPEEQEIVVLNTGSPTAGKSPGNHGHNFSYLELHPQAGARVTQYRADGGTFKPLPSFWVDSVEKCSNILFRENRLLRTFEYSALEVNVEINQDGDSFRTHRVHGFTNLGEEALRESPVPWTATVGTGQIERPVVKPDAGAPVETDLAWIKRSRQEAIGSVKFSRPVARGHKPFGFAVESYGINSYAMSAQQFSLLHPDRKTEPTEYVEMSLRKAPMRSLVIRVQLPLDLKIKNPTLLVFRAESEKLEQRFQDALIQFLTYDADKNIILLDVPRPPLGLSYRIAWTLTDEPPPAGRSFQHEGEAAIAASHLVALANLDPRNNPLSQNLLSAIAEEARIEFQLAAETSDPLSVSIMAFDRSLGKLRIAAANFADSDLRWKTQLSYGDGLAGRAFKMNSARLFIKAESIRNRIPFYCTDGESTPTDTGGEIEEEALISLPLSHPDMPKSTFGILNLSSRRLDSRLVTLTDDRITTQFRLAVSRACFKAAMELS
ncbi:3',5'-cyclic AMP phosphodiesterase CpdA [Bradyrhizobium japonicum]